MPTFLGGCHCGAVRFEAVAALDNVTECNCSICSKKGAIHHRAEAFRLLAGGDALTLYQFGTGVAKHWFCCRCGIQVFTNPRAAPDKVTINLRCLDDFQELKDTLRIRAFDGSNWEAAVGDGFRFE